MLSASSIFKPRLSTLPPPRMHACAWFDNNSSNNRLAAIDSFWLEPKPTLRGLSCQFKFRSRQFRCSLVSSGVT
jgi:hypothetical protein